MCGRYTLTVPLEDLVEEFGVTSVVLAGYRPRYNIAPGQPAPVIARVQGGLRLGELRWGFVPHWSENPGPRDKHINARSETAAASPAFREAFRRRRCLIPADGFYEWTADGPHWVHRADLGLIALAGLWESWRPRDGGDPLRSFCILTAPSTGALEQLHDRMPVIVPREARETWLNPESSPESLTQILRPIAKDLEAWPVSRLVNSVAIDEPTCIVAIDGGGH
jgi:putative SOS response-associated peptidase YedK